MSGTYAKRLKEYPNKGICGLPEIHDTKRAFTSKIRKLVELIKNAKYIVLLTGAGISTASGIPDFRGPNGIWTKEKKNELIKKRQKRVKTKNVQVETDQTEPSCDTENLSENISQEKSASNIISTNKNATDDVAANDIVVSATINFQRAQPSLTHHAITYLAQKTDTPIHLIVTQNVDGLHQRCGLSRNKLSILHGCAFTEKCNKCHREYYRDNEIDGISFQKTGRICDHCNDELVDTLLDWDDPLPEYDYRRAIDACRESDLTICLGTSLRIEPAGNLPSLSKKYVIINLQETPLDSQACIIIRADVEIVMKSIMMELGYYEDFEQECSSIHNINSLLSIERVWLPPPLSLFHQLKQEKTKQKKTSESRKKKRNRK